jgi:hypothetical protein
MSEPFETWAIIEIMGHVQLAGLVSEQVIAGTEFLRVDIPEVNGHQAFTRYYGGSAIYSITPTTEELARRAVDALRPRPVTVYGILLPERTVEPVETEEDAEWNDGATPEPGFVEEREIPYQ